MGNFLQGTKVPLILSSSGFGCRANGNFDISRGGVVQWAARLTRNVEVVGSSPIKGPRCFLEQETLPLLLSTGWFQERIKN